MNIKLMPLYILLKGQKIVRSRTNCIFAEKSWYISLIRNGGLDTMERIAGEITEWLILKGEIHESKEEILKYGFEIILSTLWTMLSTITISFVFLRRVMQ